MKEIKRVRIVKGSEYGFKWYDDHIGKIFKVENGWDETVWLVRNAVKGCALTDKVYVPKSNCEEVITIPKYKMER